MRQSDLCDWTAEPDIFVGGDVYTGPKFAIDAIAQGHYAAESMQRFVQGGHMTIGRNRWEFIELDKDNISVESYDNSSRQIDEADRRGKQCEAGGKRNLLWNMPGFRLKPSMRSPSARIANRNMRR